MINYSEFITAAIQIDEVLSEQQLWTLFKKFDVDNTDFITTENLKTAFQRQGRNRISQREIDEIIQLHDREKNGKIDFNEFKVIFCPDESGKKTLNEPSFISEKGHVSGLLKDLEPKINQKKGAPNEACSDQVFEEDGENVFRVETEELQTNRIGKIPGVHHSKFEFKAKTKMLEIDLSKSLNRPRTIEQPKIQLSAR